MTVSASLSRRALQHHDRRVPPEAQAPLEPSSLLPVSSFRVSQSACHSAEAESLPASNVQSSTLTQSPGPVLHHCLPS
eukprot:1773196-Rhodomonas_salina.1